MTWDDAISQISTAATSVAEPGIAMGEAEAEEVFTAFYQRTARQVWAYLARVSGSPTLADDLVQESYLRFLAAAAPWRDGEIACRRYLFRIATNLLRDHWRRPQTTALEDLPETALPSFISNHPDRIDLQALLGPALLRLKPRERQLLWLAYAEGYSHQEIAGITGLRAPSIRLLLFRARHKMAGLLRQKSLKTVKTV
jgi:RNA polymerase sigma-70 factor (ECF subfamily)